MSAVNDILNRIPMEQLANQLGTDQATAEQAARQAVASLLGGMQSNASDPQGEVSLASALSQHQGDGVYESARIDLGEVDTRDGEKIVSHVLGQEQPQTLGGLGGDTMNQLLRILAPIVLGYLAGKLTGGRSGGGGGLLDAILGGGSGAGAPRRGSGGGLGDLLGEMLGGGADTSTAPRSSTAGSDSPFRPVDYGTDDREQQFPTDEPAPRRQAPDDDEPAPRREGGGLGDILGGIFGKR